jgi:hypothetical protein
MLFLLSPSKALDYQTPVPAAVRRKATDPLFVDRATELIALMRSKTPAQVATLMGLSDKLAQLNAARYAAWQPQADARNSKPAVLAFDGDVYDGLQAGTLNTADLGWAQQHLVILSGLYGVLRPLDRLQAYRLEMGTPLANPRGKDLYAFWGDTLAEHLNARRPKKPRRWSSIWHRWNTPGPLCARRCAPAWWTVSLKKAARAATGSSVSSPNRRGGGWHALPCSIVCAACGSWRPLPKTATPSTVAPVHTTGWSFAGRAERSRPAALCQNRTMSRTPQVITDELRRWIVEQAEAGCRPQDIIAAMRSAGWDESLAAETMERTLRERLNELDRQASDAVPARAVPEPDLTGAPTVLHAAGREVRVLLTLRHHAWWCSVAFSATMNAHS